jgi:hypothetical protein
LEFHHRNRETKEFTIAQARQSSISIDRIEAEIAKCDVLCCVGTAMQWKSPRRLHCEAD